ncbi:hypothetical protein ESCO_000267 [Escovopsis weberi]|uniref:Uncharacterized protein n=1 Tax=Escovopsis weberi TaxID=150374 RepID=A0A0M9VTL6_ESCWE|nr:hypothetical protein ESCO_000267 [Escovopsis weberi]
MSIKKMLSSPMGTYYPIIRKWPSWAMRSTRWLMLVEFIGLVPVLVIFGLAQPDMYRTAMWQIGFDNGLNSNPNMILYAYANHRPLPNVPFIWSSKLTNFNVAISVISLFFLLLKLMCVILKLWIPIFATFVNVALVALYTVSVYGQIGPDHADPRYPSSVVWYLRLGCGLAKPSGNYQNCQIAQGSLFITLYMLVVYLACLAMSAAAMWPNKMNDAVDEEEQEEDEDKKSKEAKLHDIELQGMGFQTDGGHPFTPRTQAFQSLTRELPLRAMTEQSKY